MILASSLMSVKAVERPNVVVFLMDDLRPQLGCYGYDMVKSPNIDSLADNGLLFQKAYAQEALSAPSRMSILSGKYPENIGIYSLFTTLRSKHKGFVTLPQLFKNNGYETISLGKVYHHATDDQESWTVRKRDNMNLWLLPENQIQGKKGAPYECADVPDDAYFDGVVANQAIEELNEVKDKNFLMFVGLTKPHLPFCAPKRYWDMYNENEFKIPLRKVPVGSNTYSFAKWAELRVYKGMPEEGFVNDADTKRLIHGYHACVSYVDAQVGKVIAELERLNLRKNTIVVLIGDHGWKIGEYGAWCKHTNFEIDVNVPLIISEPTGVANRLRGKRTNSIVESVDIYATLADMCGLDAKGIDGKSLYPIVKNPKEELATAAYSLYPRGKKIMGFTCTDGKYRYTEWWDNEKSRVLYRELYTCKQDFMKQAVNLADNSSYSKLQQKLKKLLDVRFHEAARSSYPQFDK